MTVSELVERARRQLNAGQAQSAWPSSEIDLAACVMQAISEVAHRAMNDGVLRSLLQQTYSVTLDASGVGDPLAATGSITATAGEILQEGIKYGVVIDADGNILQPLTHYADFIRPQQVVYAYYCLKDRKIHTRALGQAVVSPADIVGATGPLSITASFAPTSVTHIPPELEDVLVNTLCDVVTRKTSANASPNYPQ